MGIFCFFSYNAYNDVATGHGAPSHRTLNSITLYLHAPVHWERKISANKDTSNSKIFSFSFSHPFYVPHWSWSWGSWKQILSIEILGMHSVMYVKYFRIIVKYRGNSL